MKTKKILTLALLPIIGMLTACSNDDAQLAGERVPISLSASTLTAEETRTAAGPNLNSGYIESGQAVRVRIRNTGSSGNWSDYAYTTGAGGILTLPSIPPYYPLDNTNVDIVAYTPYDAIGTFTVQDDQTNNDNYVASDLLFASATNKEKSTTAVPLQFEHKMAKIVVNVTASSNSGVSQIHSVSLQNIKRQVTFNETTGEVSNAVSYGSTTVCLAQDGTTNTSAGVAVIPAQTISGTLLTVVTDIGTATYSVNSKTFNAGKVYVMNIYVGRTAIGATTQITGWTDTESVTVNSQDDGFRTFIIHDNAGLYTFTMVKVEGGPFSTYCGQTVSGEVSDFYIGQTEVSYSVWWVLMNHQAPNVATNIGAGYPVAGMSFNEITGSGGFLEKLNAQLADQTDGMTFKLPTDIQWEYAARGGKNRENYIYSGSNSLASYYFAYQTGDSPRQFAPLGICYANSLGIYDMTGNVWEWCSDWDWAVSPNMVIPKDYGGPASGTNHRIRGGGVNCKANSANLKVSTPYVWNDADPYLGFRLVLQ